MHGPAGTVPCKVNLCWQRDSIRSRNVTTLFTLVFTIYLPFCLSCSYIVACWNYFLLLLIFTANQLPIFIRSTVCFFVQNPIFRSRSTCFFLFVAPARGFRLFVPRSSEEGVVDHGRVLFASSLESNCGVNLFAVFALVFFFKKQSYLYR
jgi:hypothetical protein